MPCELMQHPDHVTHFFKVAASLKFLKEFQLPALLATYEAEGYDVVCLVRNNHNHIDYMRSYTRVSKADAGMYVARCHKNTSVFVETTAAMNVLKLRVDLHLPEDLRNESYVNLDSATLSWKRARAAIANHSYFVQP